MKFYDTLSRPVDRSESEELEVRKEIEVAHKAGKIVEACSMDDPLSGWFEANSFIDRQGFMWDDYCYRVAN